MGAGGKNMNEESFKNDFSFFIEANLLKIRWGEKLMQLNKELLNHNELEYERRTKIIKE